MHRAGGGGERDGVGPAAAAEVVVIGRAADRVVERAADHVLDLCDRVGAVAGRRPGREIDDDRPGGARVRDGVGAEPAGQDVVARPAHQRVGPGPAVERVGAGPAGQVVGEAGADRRLDARQRVGALAGGGVGGEVHLHRPARRRVRDGVGAARTRDEVGAGVAAERVVVCGAQHVLEAGDRVGADVRAGRGAAVEVDRHARGRGLRAQRVRAAAAREVVVAWPALDRVRTLVAVQGVGLRAADEVLGPHDRVGALPGRTVVAEVGGDARRRALEADGVDAVARQDDVVARAEVADRVVAAVGADHVVARRAAEGLARRRAVDGAGQGLPVRHAPDPGVADDVGRCRAVVIHGEQHPGSAGMS